MQPVNDDMDNLFRQAAEQYPLSKHGADFGAVLQQLGEVNPPAPPEKKRRRFLWLLLLLIPLPFVYEHRHNANIKNAKNQSNKQLVTQSQQQIATLKTIPVTDFSDSNKNLPNNTTSNKTIAVAKTNNVTNTSSSSSKSSIRDSNTFVNKEQQKLKNNINNNFNTPTTGVETTTPYTIFQEKSSSRKTQLPLALKENTYANKSKKKVPVNKTADEETALLYASNSGAVLTKSSDTITINKKAIIADTVIITTDSTEANNAYKTDTTKNTIAQQKKAADSTSNTAKKKDKKSNAAVTNFLYIGAVAGTDISTVKSANTHGLGYNGGLIIGYRLGKRLAVESGLLWNFKKYFADGQYVSTEKMGLQSHTEVLNIDGSCGMLEIPLTVQYHFGNVGKSHWYAATGVFSYLMKNEEYYYLYKRYNTIYYSEKEYTNSTQNWFSVLQLSAGYQLQIGKRSSLRLEPYLKLPLAKIGIAQLPLSSAGINVGYILPFK